MEFPFNISNIFKERITVIDNKLALPRGYHSAQTSHRDELCQVIDKMGEASAKAQGLHGPITSSTKLAFSDHHLYVLKDETACGGKGCIVGIIKTGHKKLFVYDKHGIQHEVDPLCVLDFYVHESRQRMGCGKILFENVLRETGLKPQHIAIDRPSHKFLSFLQKHYHLKATIPQVNNFVVFDGFFRDRPPDNRRKHSKPPIHPYRHQGGQLPPVRPPSGRLTAPPSPHDAAGLAQLQREKEALKDIPFQRSLSRDDSASTSSSGLGRTRSRDSSPAPPTAPNIYSRHSATPPLALEQPREGQHAAQTQPEKPGPHRAPSPPLLRRDGPSKDFLRLKNGLTHHREYQDSRGRLRLADSPYSTVTEQNARATRSAVPSRSPTEDLPLAQQQHSHSARPHLTRNNDSALNIFGVPSGYQHPSARKYQKTRLW